MTAYVTRRGIRRPGRNAVPYRDSGTGVATDEVTKARKKRRKRERESGGLELSGQRHDGTSSDIRFYKERAGILERSRNDWRTRG